MFDHRYLFEPDISHVELELDVVDVYDEDAETTRSVASVTEAAEGFRAHGSASEL